MKRYLITYRQINPTTSDWNEHEIEVKGEEHLTTVVLGMLDLVTTGDFAIMSCALISED